MDKLENLRNIGAGLGSGRIAYVPVRPALARILWRIAGHADVRKLYRSPTFPVRQSLASVHCVCVRRRVL